MYKINLQYKLKIGMKKDDRFFLSIVFDVLYLIRQAEIYPLTIGIHSSIL